MRTSLPFHGFSVERFLKVRFTPVLLCYATPDVDEFFRASGMTFCEFLAGLGVSQDAHPVRVVDYNSLSSLNTAAFLRGLLGDLSVFANSFVLPEFEATGTINPDLVPLESNFPDMIAYPSRESRNPPWYRWMLCDLFKWHSFFPYDFVDFPLCIVYATVHGKPYLERGDFIKTLKALPGWIAQYAGEEKDIPIARIPVYDA
jgi:hypothetical protein